MINTPSTPAASRPGARRRPDCTPAEARALQERMASQVVVRDELPPLRMVAGLDCSCGRFDRQAWGAAVLLTWPDLEPLQVVTATADDPWPYIPGLLGFREAPVLLRALEGLDTRPDLLFVDGQGIAHPRRFGLACHLGVATGLPAVGVAKSLLVGTHGPVGVGAGATEPLRTREQQVGWALRTRAAVAPVLVSPGHRVGLETSVALVLQACRGWRLPEPTRRADRAVGEARRATRDSGHALPPVQEQE